MPASVPQLGVRAALLLVADVSAILLDVHAQRHGDRAVSSVMPVALLILTPLGLSALMPRSWPLELRILAALAGTLLVLRLDGLLILTLGGPHQHRG